MKFILNFFNQPYPYYIPFSRSFKLLWIFSLIIPAFLLIFQPFGLGIWSCPQKEILIAGIFIPIFLILAINFYGISSLFPSFFNEDRWSIWREGLWWIWNVGTIIIATAYYWTVVPFCPTESIQWSTQLINSVLIGIFPGSVCLYFNYSRALKRKLNKVEIINQQLLSKVAYYEKDHFALTSENENEKVNLSTDTFLYVQAYDNYCKIVFRNGNGSESKLIRSSLKKIESQIHFPFIIRCHRSFIVNLTKVKRVKGNAREYRLIMYITEPTIPVSRESYKKVISLLQEYPPMQEEPNGTVAYNTI